MVGWGILTLTQYCAVWGPGATMNMSALVRECAKVLGMEQGRELTTLLGKLYGEEVTLRDPAVSREGIPTMEVVQRDFHGIWARTRGPMAAPSPPAPKAPPRAPEASWSGWTPPSQHKFWGGSGHGGPSARTRLASCALVTSRARDGRVRILLVKTAHGQWGFPFGTMPICE